MRRSNIFQSMVPAKSLATPHITTLQMILSFMILEDFSQSSYLIRYFDTTGKMQKTIPYFETTASWPLAGIYLAYNKIMKGNSSKMHQ